MNCKNYKLLKNKIVIVSDDYEINIIDNKEITNDKLTKMYCLDKLKCRRCLNIKDKESFKFNNVKNTHNKTCDECLHKDKQYRPYKNSLRGRGRPKKEKIEDVK